MILELTLLAAFAAPSDEDVRALVTKAVGQDVPEKFLCVARPKLPAPFEKDIIVAGVKLKTRGCVIKGVVVDGVWTASDVALPAALGIPAKSLPANLRGAALEAWTRDVVFAFDQVVSVTADPKRPVVSATYHRRTVHTLVASTIVTKVDYAETPMTMADTSVKTEIVSLALNPLSIKGIDKGALVTALESHGKLFEQCLWAAWNEDLTLSERTRFTWSIGKGKADKLAARQSPNNKLTQCYANVIGAVEFPADGEVDLEFGIQRRAFTP